MKFSFRLKKLNEVHIKRTEGTVEGQAQNCGPKSSMILPEGHANLLKKVEVFRMKYDMHVSNDHYRYIVRQTLNGLIGVQTRRQLDA